jgi:hypothetical protein
MFSDKDRAREWVLDIIEYADRMGGSGTDTGTCPQSAGSGTGTGTCPQ